MSDRKWALVVVSVLALLAAAASAAHEIRDGRGLDGNELLVIYLVVCAAWAASLVVAMWRSRRR